MIRVLVTGQELRFLAKDMRTERTGVHASIFVFLNSDMLDWDTFNVGRSEDRTKLVNRAHKRMGTLLGGLYSKEWFDHDMDYFCLRVREYDSAGSLAEELEGKPYRTQFYLEPYIAAGAGTIVFAKPGSTKSYLALLMAVSIDAGLSSLWRSERRRVLLINLERSKDSMLGRLYRVNTVLAQPGDRKLLMINARGKTMAAVAEGAARDIKRHHVDCVILDSISRAGGDLNDNKDANAVMDVLNGFGGAWLAVGHPPLADQGRVFGSQMFSAAADLTVQINSQQRGMMTAVSLTMRKFNDVPPRAPEIFALSFDERGLIGIRRASGSEFPELEVEQRANLAADILSVLPSDTHVGMQVAEIFRAVTENGIETTSRSVGSTLSANKEDMFRNWKESRGKATASVLSLIHI